MQPRRRSRVTQVVNGAKGIHVMLEKAHLKPSGSIENSRQNPIFAV